VKIQRFIEELMPMCCCCLGDGAHNVWTARNEYIHYAVHHWLFEGTCLTMICLNAIVLSLDRLVTLACVR
jgi:hypothetical protein